jgi:hypothetical protein
MTSVGAVLQGLLGRPKELLWCRWNWKSALYSSLIRASIFLVVNLSAGLRAAAGAMLAEFCYRAATAGFYGSITQAFRKVEPRWQGTAAATTLLVLLSHSIEFIVHLLRGTPNLKASILASVAFTLLSTVFNLYAMRKGVFVTDSDARSLAADFRMLPGVLVGFLRQVPDSFKNGA